MPIVVDMIVLMAKASPYHEYARQYITHYIYYAIVNGRRWRRVVLSYRLNGIWSPATLTLINCLFAYASTRH